MGFSGGGANVTKAHQHDGTVVQDGGELAANATQFGLTNGSLLYSDGSNIQELGVGASGYVLGTASGTVPTWEASAASIVMNVNGQMVYYDGSRTALDIGSEADVLTVSAGGLPVWSAPAPPSQNYQFIERFTKGTANDTFTCTLSSALNVTDFVDLVLIWRGQWDVTSTGVLNLQIATNNETPISGGRYSWMANVLTSSSTFVASTDVTQFSVGPSTTTFGSIGTIYMSISVPDVEGAGGDPSNIYCKWWQVGANTVQSRGSGFVYDDEVVSSIDGFYFTNDAGNGINAATTLDVYKVVTT